MKKNTNHRVLVLTILVIALLVIQILATQPEESTRAKSVDAMLTVEIKTVPERSDSGSIELCFSHPPCVKLEKTSPDTFEFPKALARQYGDHPFVDYPDDWDHLYLSRGPGVTTIKSIYIRFDVNYNLADDFVANMSFVFVDWAASKWITSYRYVTGVNILDLSPLIEFNRRKQVVEALGETDLSPANVNAIYDALPAIVKSGAGDIGQSGLIKYKGDYDEDENGCDEYYCWHYIESDFYDAYDVLDHCNCQNADCFAPTPACCPFGCSDDQEPKCWETRCFKFDDNVDPARYVCNRGVSPKTGWKHNGRLAQVYFYHDANMNRLGIDQIYRVHTMSFGEDDYDDWLSTGERYYPKAGDMLYRLDNCPRYIPDAPTSSHVMMFLSDLSDDGKYITASVIEKSTLVVAGERAIAAFNEKCKNPDGSLYLNEAGVPVFHWNFYIGEVR